jgi:NAD(P)-dependent dehydrogenase (short-subunit alcohol dehydrogenase family)
MIVPETRRVREKMGKLEGKVAVVTGGNSGIGLATAKEFAREGARVVITGRDRRTLSEAAREIGGDVLALRSDSSSLGDIDGLFAAVGERFGRVDVLFVNAGVGKFAPVEETDEELFDQIMDINFKGAYFTVKKALPLLADGASVVLNTSVVAHIGFPNASVYSASKAALLSLVRTLSADLIGRGIRVNAVSPGPVETPIFGRLGLPPEAKDETMKNFREQVPLKRFGRPEEIAKAVLFLASPDSSFLVGTEIVADGGVSGFKVQGEVGASQGAELRAEAA